MSNLVKNPDVVIRDEDESGALLFNPDTGQVRMINSTGLFIWELCDGTRDQANIVDAIRNAFEVEATDFIPEVESFIKGMMEVNLIGVVVD